MLIFLNSFSKKKKKKKKRKKKSNAIFVISVNL